MLIFLEQSLHMASVFELGHIPRDYRWADSEHLSHILSSLSINQDFGYHIYHDSRCQWLTLSSSMSRHRSCIFYEISKICIFEVFLALEIPSIHLLCEYGHIMNILLKPESILIMLL